MRDVFCFVFLRDGFGNVLRDGSLLWVSLASDFNSEVFFPERITLCDLGLLSIGLSTKTTRSNESLNMFFRQMLVLCVFCFFSFLLLF